MRVFGEEEGDTDVLPTQQGIIVLGTPSGDAAFIQAHLEMKATEQRTLLDRIPLMSDLQSTWLIPRANWHIVFDDFAAGKWLHLLSASRKCDDEASQWQ